MTQNYQMARLLSCPGALENMEYPLLPGPHLPEVVAPIKVPSMGQMKLFNRLLYLNHSTEGEKMKFGSFNNNVTYKLFVYKSSIFNINVWTRLVLNNLQELICNKTKPTNQPF